MAENRVSLFIFRRDLRLQDNTGLIAALQSSEKVIPCFIFDPRQVDDNPYKSNNAIQFMIESLQEIDQIMREKQSKLYTFYGIAHDVVEKLLTHHPIDAVYVNRDYTPFSIQRDAAIEDICQQYGRYFHPYNDLLLNEPEEIFTNEGHPYSVFTYFYKKSFPHTIPEPEKNLYRNYWTKNIDLEEIDLPKELTDNGTIIKQKNDAILVHGGRENGLAILRHINNWQDYDETRDYPSDNTTHLSAHHKFGTISIRESFHTMQEAFGKKCTLIQQLYWRDFYTYIAFHNHYIFGSAFREKYNELDWEHDTSAFERWCEGKTGFPIVDAGMRQLNTCGFMHNRVRMIVASFLTKDLHMDWQKGEKYFAQQLVDYDPAVNNGNWQWTASTGCDAQPYFRIFNPWTQAEKHDPDCTYIKKWVPELQELSTKQIHNWHKKQIDGIDYPAPMLEHSDERKKALSRYKSVV
jgi:deoxyribodipyrimidine photo-lyase